MCQSAAPQPSPPSTSPQPGERQQATPCAVAPTSTGNRTPPLRQITRPNGRRQQRGPPEQPNMDHHSARGPVQDQRHIGGLARSGVMKHGHDL
jgi:hypothetical protein